MRKEFMFTVAAALAGCAGAAGEQKLAARLVGKSGQALASQQLALMNGFEGLYFGELEIVAYDHRPGEAVQASGGFGRTGGPSADWSYWVALQSGHDAGRDNVLAPGQQIDFAAMNGDFARPIEQEFVDQVGAFEIDFFEVYLYRTGVIHGGKYYGQNAELNGHTQHPLHKYPQWSSIDDAFCSPEFPGVPASTQDVNVLFARSDWFPVAGVVSIGGDNQTLTIDSSTITLSQTQQELLESLVNQGTGRRFYSHLVIIPFNGPVAVDLAGTATPVPGATQTVAAGDLVVTVDFDLTDVLDAATDFSAPRVVYKGDQQNVPFGLAISFDN
jgi:hypothetical protein